MDELVDVLDVSGAFTGKRAMKSEVHLKGWYHASVHVWLYTITGKVLIQLRTATKDTHPLFWDVSVAGHIGAGEDPETSAVREVAEEVGLDIVPANLEKIGIFLSDHTHSKTFIDREFHHTYIAPVQPKLDQFTKQESEVAALDFISLDELQPIGSGLGRLNFVPYAEGYLERVYKAIRNRL